MHAWRRRLCRSGGSAGRVDYWVRVCSAPRRRRSRARQTASAQFMQQSASQYRPRLWPMRLWSLHPKYLDSKGLVALWREGLLAQAVLRGRTRGYRHHPQLTRFREHPRPLAAMSNYLEVVYNEARARGYSFDRSKIRAARKRVMIPVSQGQVRFEWRHLLRKLRDRSPHTWQSWSKLRIPQAHPLFTVRHGPIEPWEK
jgi:hypothetical protein